jgi:hypothetical protein
MIFKNIKKLHENKIEMSIELTNTGFRVIFKALKNDGLISFPLSLSMICSMCAVALSLDSSKGIL